jgi:hypothetical protein
VALFQLKAKHTTNSLFKNNKTFMKPNLLLVKVSSNFSNCYNTKKLISQFDLTFFIIKKGAEKNQFIVLML